MTDRDPLGRFWAPYAHAARALASLVVELREAECHDHAAAVTRLHDYLVTVAAEHRAELAGPPAGLRVIKGGKR
jgi:hypothetical protein